MNPPEKFEPKILERTYTCKMHIEMQISKCEDYWHVSLPHEFSQVEQNGKKLLSNIEGIGYSMNDAISNALKKYTEVIKDD